MAAATDQTAANHQSLALINHLARVSRRGSQDALGPLGLRPLHVVALALLRDHWRATHNARGGAVRPLGLRPLHVVALTLLRDHGSATQQALAEALRIDASNLVGLLNDLESRHLLLRQRDPGDRRRHIVELSGAGRSTLQRAERKLAAVQDDVLGALNDDERDTLHALLLRAAGGQLPGGGCAEVDAGCA